MPNLIDDFKNRTVPLPVVAIGGFVLFVLTVAGIMWSETIGEAVKRLLGFYS